MTDWAIRLHVPTISFHLGTKEGEEKRGEKLLRMMGEIPVVYLYGRSFLGGNRAKEGGKKVLFPLYCQDDRFIVSIKSKNLQQGTMSNSYWETEDPMRWKSTSLFFPLCGCGRSSNSLWGFNPIKKTIIYVHSVPEDSARPLFSITQA